MNTTRPKSSIGARTVTLLLTTLALVVATLAATALPAQARAARPASTAHTAVTPQAAAAAGKLTPSGCVRAGGQAQCDLYAMTGTTQLLGTTLPIWGFSTSGTAGSATAPGPVLVVAQGDTVTITLHNQL